MGSRLDTQFKQAEDSPGFLLWQLSNKWQSQQRAALQQFGLTHVQFVLLASLTFAAGKVQFTQKQLAAHAHTDAMMTSQVLRTLEKKGLVQRQASTHDGRAFTITATAAGQKKANQAVKAVEAVDARFFAVLPLPDQQRLLSIMRRLVG